MTDSQSPTAEHAAATQPRAGIRALLGRLNAAVEKRLRESIDRQVVSAFIMVAISVTGAVAAYRVGMAEQRSIMLERRLAHGQLQDISFRQELLAEVLVRIGLAGTQRQLLSDASEFRSALEHFPNGGRGAADWLGWRASELVQQRNAMLPYSGHLRDLTSDKGVEEELSDRSAEKLREQGFLAVADNGKAARPAVKFPQLQKAIKESHEIGAALALCVLLFVSGLVCLTLAELNLGPALVWLGLTGAGTAIAVAASTAVVWIDLTSAWIIVPLAAVLTVVTMVLVRSGAFRVPHNRAHTTHPEILERERAPFAHLAGHSSQDGWSRSIVLYITAAVFVSAVFGWFYSVSQERSGHFAQEAQERKTELVNLRGRLGASTMGGKFDQALKILRSRIRCASATQLASLAGEGMIGVDAARARDERQKRCGDYDKLVAVSGWLVDELDADNLADSANNPARRLGDVVLDRAWGPEETLALSDGYAEISVGWNKRAALMLAVLTILAISLYLFGQAYSMGETLAGRWLIRSGAAMLGLSIGLGLFAWLRPSAETPASALPAPCTVVIGGSLEHAGAESDEATAMVELAARKYADGVAHNNLADTSPRGSPQRANEDAAAAESFKCAALARPGFIAAYQKYERLIARMDSPQRGEASFISLNSRTKLGELHSWQQNELKTFVSAGMLRPLKLLGNYAFDSTVLALAEGRPEALAEARTALDTVTGTASWWGRLQTEWLRPELWSDELPSSDAGDWLNLGLSQLATGEPGQLSQAELTYDKALANAKHWSPALLAGTLTDLEVLETYCKKLHPGVETCRRISEVIERVRPRVAGGIATGDASMGSTTTASAFAVTATPYSFKWRLRLNGFDDKRDRLTVAWFRDDTQVPGKPADPKRWQVRRVLYDFFEMYYPDSDLILPKAGADGIIEHEVSSLGAAGVCIAPGRYLAKLFLNGKLIQSMPAVVEPHGLRLYRSRDLDLTWCIPEAWVPRSATSGRHQWSPGKPVREFVSPDGSDASVSGGAILTFFAPSSMSASVRRSYFLRRTIQILLRKGEPGGNGIPPGVWTQAKEDHLLRISVPFDKLKDADCQVKEGRNDPVYHVLTTPSDESLVHIAIVYGQIPAQQRCAMLSSLRNHF